MAVRFRAVVRVPYSTDQKNALIDMQLYGLPYGVEVGSDDYIKEWLNAAGEKYSNFSISLDDANLEYIVTLC